MKASSRKTRLCFYCLMLLLSPFPIDLRLAMPHGQADVCPQASSLFAALYSLPLPRNGQVARTVPAWSPSNHFPYIHSCGFTLKDYETKYIILERLLSNTIKVIKSDFEVIA